MSTSPATALARRLLEESGLASSHPAIDEKLVDQLLDRHFHLGGRLERLATEKDDTFRLRAGSNDYLVKVSPPGEPQPVVALQTAAMRHLEFVAPELPVQRVRTTVDGADDAPVTVADGGTRVMRVFDFIDGAVLARTTAGVEQLARVGEVLGRVDRALESFAHPAAQRGLVWDLQHFHELTELLEDTSRAEHRQLAREAFRLFGDAIVPRLGELETQVIHGDYSPHNVIVDPNSDDFVTGVIDFGDAVRSPAIFDPAVSVANLLGRTPNHPWWDACAFMAGYLQARPIKDGELALLPVAGVARLTLRALITNWRAKRVVERRDYLLDHAKDDWTNIERALATPLDRVVTQLREFNAPAPG